jgi:hypothetical protein
MIACYPRHRHEEFLKFLKKAARACPGSKNPRITLHFTPASGSWLNMAEIGYSRACVS